MSERAGVSEGAEADGPDATERAGAVPQRVGRYILFDSIAIGGMAEVFLGQLKGPVGFARTVAVKRLHRSYALDREFRTMFADEARLAARVRHPNVVSTLDVLVKDDELYLVMDYVHGEPLSRILDGVEDRRVPMAIAASIAAAMLNGLHAAHEASGDDGAALGIVHRDISPQNVMVGADGVPRILDFGIAKATSNLHTTRLGQMKGKPPYMAPEQVTGDPIDRRVDVFATGVVLWEMLTGRRLFVGDSLTATLTSVMLTEASQPSTAATEPANALDRVVLKALAKRRDDRFATAQDMAVALENALPLASAREVGEWVERAVGKTLATRAEAVAFIERTSASLLAVATPAQVTPLGPLPSVSAMTIEPPAEAIESAADRGARTLPGKSTPTALAMEEEQEPYHSPELAQTSIRRRLTWGIAVGTAVFVCTLLAIGAASHTRANVTQASFVASASAPAAPRPVLASVPTASASSTPPPVPETPQAPIAAHPSATSAPASAAFHPTSNPQPATQPRVATEPSATAAIPSVRRPDFSASSPVCDPPFTLDAQGRKRFNHACFEK